METPLDMPGASTVSRSGEGAPGDQPAMLQRLLSDLFPQLTDTVVQSILDSHDIFSADSPFTVLQNLLNNSNTMTLPVLSPEQIAELIKVSDIDISITEQFSWNVIGSHIR